MTLSPDLKEILACPKCKGGLEFHEDRGEIHCLGCRLVFRIDGGIPVMLIEEAKPLEGGSSTQGEIREAR
jgi:uncharacterized protein YbaR (Trm112 family)